MFISLFKCNQPKTEISVYKMVGLSVELPFISCLFSMLFNFGYVHTLKSGLNKCVYRLHEKISAI